MLRVRLVVLFVFMAVVVSFSLAQQPPADLTATFFEGSTKSSVAIIQGGYRVTDDVKNTTNNDMNFGWDAENKSPFAGKVVTKGSNNQSWSYPNALVPSTKGSIKLTDVSNGNLIAQHTAQKYIPPQGGGGGGPLSLRGGRLFGRQPVVADRPPTYAMGYGEWPLYGEYSASGKLLFRIETRAVDVTGKGDYIVMAVAYNGTDFNLTFLSEDGLGVEVGPGDWADAWYDAGDFMDLLEVKQNTWEVTAVVGRNQFETYRLQGHVWTLAR